MSLPASNLIDLIWDLADIHWSRLIGEGAQAKLSILAPAASEEPANAVDKCRVLRSAINLPDVWPIVIVKIDKSRTKYNSHTPIARTAASTLSVIIVAPRVHIARPA